MSEIRKGCWNFFVDIGYERGKCVKCSKIFAAKNGDLSNFAHHLRRSHPEIDFDEEVRHFVKEEVQEGLQNGEDGGETDDNFLVSVGADREIVLIGLPSFSSDKHIRAPQDGQLAMAREKKSIVWEHFEKADGIVTCTICGKTLKFFGNTTNLRDHLRRRHPDELQQSEEYAALHNSGQHANSYEATSQLNADEGSDVAYNLSAEFSKNFPSKVRYTTDEDEDILKMIAGRLNAASQSSKHATFGHYVAEQLDAMSPGQAALCKKIISEIIYEADMGNLTQYSRVVNEPPPNS